MFADDRQLTVRNLLRIIGGVEMKSYSSTKIIRLLKKKGWYEVSCVGDHHQFKHSERPGRLTVPHPKKNLPIGTVKSILHQAGIKDE